MKIETENLKLRPTVLSIPFSILGLFTAIRILEILNVIIFPTVYRVTTPQPFFVYLTGTFLTDDIAIVAVAIATALTLFGRRNPVLYIISLPLATLIVLSVIWQNVGIANILVLVALPSIIFSYLFSKRQGLQYSRIITRNSLIFSTVLVFLSIEVISLITWLSYPIFPSKIYSGWQWYGADIESKLFYAFGLLSTAFMAILIFSFGLKPAKDSVKQWKIFRDTYRKAAAGTPSEITVTPQTGLAILIAACIVVTLLSIYPYLPSINGDFKLVSVDAPFYINQINLIKEDGVFAEGGPFDRNVDRAFSLLIFYAIVSVVNQPPQFVVPLLPIPLGISLVLSVFYLVRYAVKNVPLAAPIAAVVTAFSTQFIVGVYAGFFSNMLALSISFFAILFLLRYHDGKRAWFNLVLFGLAVFAILLLHVYTWVFLTSSLIVAIALYTMTNGGAKRWEEIKRNIPVILILFSTMATVFAIASATSISGISHLSGLVSSSIGSDYFAERWFNMNYTFRLYLGGFLTNSVLISLALVWALKEKLSNRFNAIILSSMFITSVFFFFGDSLVQSRMFYNIPLQIPAGIVIGSIASGSILGSLSTTSRLLLIALVALHLANYALRSLANLYLLG